MAEPFAAYARQSDFHAALIANDAAVFHALVLAAQALPVLGRTKDARTEKTVALRLKSSIVNSLRLGNFAVGPAPDFLRRRQRDADGVEIRDQIRSIVWRGSQNKPPKKLSAISFQPSAKQPEASLP